MVLLSTGSQQQSAEDENESKQLSDPHKRWPKQSSFPSQSPSNIQQGFELEQQSHVVSSVFPDQAHSVKESAKKMSKVKNLYKIGKEWIKIVPIFLIIFRFCPFYGQKLEEKCLNFKMLFITVKLHLHLCIYIYKNNSYILKCYAIMQNKYYRGKYIQYNNH